MICRPITITLAIRTNVYISRVVWVCGIVISLAEIRTTSCPLFSISISMKELLTTGVVSALHPPGSSLSGSYAILSVRNPSKDSPSGSIPLLLGLSSGSPENHLTHPVPSSVIIVPMGRVLISGLMYMFKHFPPIGLPFT